ncbi:uncharacterized protein LOC109725063 isoform X3 [Ananas comosus]|uniref:Uncharacterized protein LOC109725063 isoform X3 n=1 Tax=Ananas comosus TaxID=4615 RepID=A0A6P5GVV3_ANACO|nr:uncharacterized protein LOC109725063 isoform X3 [Ananas comosus]
MKSSLRHEKPSIRKTGREAPGSEFDLDRRGSKETINDQGVSSAAAANPMAFDPRKMKRNSAIDVRRELCEKIHAKMQFLEEDTRLMKEAILDCVKDRDILMSEDDRKDIGLLGVLHQDLTPTLVARRAKKINVDAFDN